MRAWHELVSRRAVGHLARAGARSGGRLARAGARSGGRIVRAGARKAEERVTEAVGGEARTMVVVLLAAVLGLSSADTSTVGAAGGPLRQALHLNFTQVGLLVALPSLASAIATVPVGALSDRVRRVPLLAGSVVLWSVAMAVSGAASSFEMLLLTRLALGVVTATSGPTLASLTGDFFHPQERGRIYGFILTGDLVGSVVGLFFAGDAAALSWRLAFWILVIPSAVLAWALWRKLPEPARGGASRLDPGASEILSADEVEHASPRMQPSPAQAAEPVDEVDDEARSQLAQTLARLGIEADPDQVLTQDPGRLGLSAAVRYVLSIRTNVALIIVSALGYFLESGILTFGVIFVRHQYRVAQAVATMLLAVVALGAVLGIIGSGRLADALLARGRIWARPEVAGSCFLAACGLFVLPLLTHSLVLALPLLFLAGAALLGANPPLDAARLDIMPPRLWGRAEGVRTVLRSLATAAAPILFGLISDLLTGPHSARIHTKSGQSASAAGLRDTYLIMLLPLAAGGIALVRARRSYPRDVATALASARAERRSSRGEERQAPAPSEAP